MGETANGSLNTPARWAHRTVRQSVGTPWPAYIKYPRAVSGAYGAYSVATPWAHLDAAVTPPGLI